MDALLRELLAVTANDDNNNDYKIVYQKRNNKMSYWFLLFL